ncbi:hypothetical protein B0T13DRAFT_486170 [Neurospora crassa]|nr:hypothetical protein B0T13DRAFT_486170 [Neurospora crassa]
MAPKILHRFYEPIMLLEALKGPIGEPSSGPSQAMRVDDEDPKQLFQAFVYRLAHVCDREKGGNTVTSIMVLDTSNVLAAEQEVLFVFGVNQATRRHLEHTAQFLQTVLEKVASAPPKSDREGREAAERELWQTVLRFNRPRVKFYLKSLREKAEECLRQCEVDEKEEDREIARGLQDLLESEDYAVTEMTSEAEYDRKCNTITRQLRSIFASTRLNAILIARAAAGRTAMTGHASMECWSDLVHVAQRIRAYRASVHSFFKARDEWPHLFQGKFHILGIPSADLQEIPRRNKSLQAESIVGRMTSNEKLMTIFKRFVQDLQMHNLDTRLVDAYESNKKLAVHSEVLLHHWLLTDRGKGEISPTMFFNSWPYIGSSKPTCKLCNYYFEESRSGVEVRASHGNLYPKWRLPDVYDFHGSGAVKRRQIMLDRILQRVRAEVFNVIKKKSPLSYKHEDSNTWSATMQLDDRLTQNQTDAGADTGTRAGTVVNWDETSSVIVQRDDVEPASGIENDVDSNASLDSMQAMDRNVEDLRGLHLHDKVDEVDVRTKTGMEQDEDDDDDEDDDNGGGAAL